MCKQTEETVSFAEKNYRFCKSCVRINNRKYAEKKGIPEKFIPLITTTHKQCGMCKELKPFGDYTKSKRGRNGIATYCKPCMSQYQLKYTPLEERRIKTQAYRDSNREWWRSLHRLNQYNRRSTIASVSDGTVTKDFVKKVYAETHCYYCNEETPEKFRTLEHKQPLKKRGLHSALNITMACLSCNTSKSSKTEEEFNKYIQWKKSI